MNLNLVKANFASAIKSGDLTFKLTGTNPQRLTVRMKEYLSPERAIASFFMPIVFETELDKWVHEDVLADAIIGNIIKVAIKYKQMGLDKWNTFGL